ncbi:MAG: hypothetical protein JO233_08750 [Candidatus Eremiobacteraeota bacterium]|nr:hypothetical protein [Candidatus Eremiobacteraeota bacterium]
MTTYLSLRFQRMLASAEASSLAAHAHDAGWDPQVKRSEGFARTYALLTALREDASDAFVSEYSGAVQYRDPLLALSIEPDAPEGLTSLAAALTGSGAPEGVVAAEIIERNLLIEFIPERTSWRLVRALIDVELRRYGSTVRRTTLLSPITPEMETRIAADSLQEPELDQSRVLEALIGDADR